MGRRVCRCMSWISCRMCSKSRIPPVVKSVNNSGRNCSDLTLSRFISRGTRINSGSASSETRVTSFKERSAVAVECTAESSCPNTVTKDGCPGKGHRSVVCNIANTVRFMLGLGCSGSVVDLFHHQLSNHIAIWWFDMDDHSCCAAEVALAVSGTGRLVTTPPFAKTRRTPCVKG